MKRTPSEAAAIIAHLELQLDYITSDQSVWIEQIYMISMKLHEADNKRQHIRADLEDLRGGETQVGEP